jgi:polyisoprenoid-binding protein YceI
LPSWSSPGRRVCLSVVMFVSAAGVCVRAATTAQLYQVVQAQSRAIIEVGKAGALSFVAGHAHEVEAPVRGTLSVDPAFPEGAAVSIEIRAADLRVTGKGDPPKDVPKVQEKMTSPAVLDVERRPTITFRSTRIAVRERRGTAVDLLVTGDLTLLGATKPLTVPVHAEFTTNTVTARGTMSIKQSDYGITPISVGGVVAVKDELTIHFAIVAGS